MIKRIKKSKLDSLLGQSIKKHNVNVKEIFPKSDEISHELDKAEDNRPDWYPETYTDETKNSKKANLFSRLRNIKRKAPEVTHIQSGSTNILDIIAPSSADLTHRDYVTVDGVHFAYLYLTGYGYTTNVGNGWLNPLIEAGEGVNIIFTINRQPKDKTLSKISQATMLNRSRMRDVGDTRTDYEELDIVQFAADQIILSSCRYIRQSLQLRVCGT